MISDSEFDLKVLRNSYQGDADLDADGSISCEIKCPLQGCAETFKILHKSYKSTYQKKNNAPFLRKPPPKWHMERLCKHI